MTEVLANAGGINWCWYHRYEYEDKNGRFEGKCIWSERFHRFDTNQGADRHPETDWSFSFGTSKPKLRTWEGITEDRLKQEQDSFDFFWKGWESNCKQFGVGTDDYLGFVILHNYKTKESLTIYITELKGA